MYHIPSNDSGAYQSSEDTTIESKRPMRKRKTTNYTEYDECHDFNDTPFPKKPKTPTSNHTRPSYSQDELSPKNTSKNKSTKTAESETKCENQKRLRRFRKHAPQSYIEIKERALTQRLTVLSRERCGTEEIPEEEILMAGSTGNVYTQRIGLVPSCDCPHAKKGNQCKHIIYVMLRVLKAPENIAYQLSLTSSELRSLFSNAASIPAADTGATSGDGNRKPIDGECPICYCEFEASEQENIVYCKIACGNNVHKDCMASWASAKKGKATCPYCRAKWEDVTLSVGNVNLKGATRHQDGYLNVASQLGLSGERDYSSYHRPWVYRNSYYGRRQYES